MGKKKPKHEKRGSIISVRTTSREKQGIKRSIKHFRMHGVTTMSDLLLYAYKKLVE